MFEPEKPRPIRVSEEQHDEFWTAVNEGRVWVSGLGLGAGEADITIAGGWTGTPAQARHLFFKGLEHGSIAIDRARVVRR